VGIKMINNQNNIIVFTDGPQGYEGFVEDMGREEIDVRIIEDKEVSDNVRILPNLIIVDYKDKHNIADSIKILKEKRITKKVPVLVISENDKEFKLEVLKEGAACFIDAPFESRELFLMARNLFYLFNNQASRKVKALYHLRSAVGKILIVDEDKVILSILSGRYKNKGYEVTVLDKPNEALKLVKAEHFDLMVTDFYMETINGEEFIKEVKAFNSNLKIIVLSGQKNEEQIKTALEAGIDDYVKKPFSMVELDLRIKKFIEER
jgi:DNA-binding response OmpR family regulator